MALLLNVLFSPEYLTAVCIAVVLAWGEINPEW